MAFFNKIMRKTIKYLQEVEKLRFSDVGKVKKLPSSKVENNEIKFVDDKKSKVENEIKFIDDKKSKGNVTLEDLDSEDEMENKREVDPEILDIFDKPLEEPKAKTNKKRKFEESSEKKVAKEKNPQLEEFIESAKNSSKYKMTGIQDTTGIDVSQGIVSLATNSGSSRKKIKSHHLKDAEEESKLEKEEKESQKFKKGGKRKRKIKI
jgi:hypothetical protein